MADPSNSEPTRFCRKVSSFDSPNGFEIYKEIKIPGEGGVPKSVIQKVATLSPEAIVPCDLPMQKKMVKRRTNYMQVNTNFGFSDPSEPITEGVSYVNVGDFGEDPDEAMSDIGTEKLRDLGETLTIDMAGAKGRTIKVFAKDVHGKTIETFPRAKDPAYGFELINARIEVKETMGREALTFVPETVDVIYSVKIRAPYPPYVRFAEIDAKEFGVTAEPYICQPKPPTPRSETLAESAKKTIESVGEGISDGELNRMLFHLSKACISQDKIVNAQGKDPNDNTYDGRVIRRHLWDKHWKNEAEKDETHLISEGRDIPEDKLYAIDALARTLYRELDDAQCNSHGDHYMKGVAKIIMNRVEYEQLTHGQTGLHHAMSGGAFHTTMGRREQNSNKVFRKFTYDDEMDGFNPFGQPLHKILPYVLEASGAAKDDFQFEPWARPNLSRTWGSRQSKDTILCPQPENDKARDIWRQAVKIASNAVLEPEAFNADIEGVDEYYFSMQVDPNSKAHRRKGRPHLSNSHCAQSRYAPYCNTVGNDDKVNGEYLVPRKGQANRTNSQFYCLQRWDSPWLPKLKDIRAKNPELVNRMNVELELNSR